MPRKPARLGESDVRRVVSAYRKEGISVRVIYRADGSTVFEPVRLTNIGIDHPAGAEERAA
jgi:hypothetical protein